MFLTCLTVVFCSFTVIVSISRIELPTKICFKIGVKKIAHSKQIFVRRKWCKVKAQFLNYQIFLNFFQKKFKSHSLVTENDVRFSFCDCKGRVFFWTGKIKSDFFRKKMKKRGKLRGRRLTPIIYMCVCELMLAIRDEGWVIREYLRQKSNKSKTNRA